jgi:hypothetical protein
VVCNLNKEEELLPAHVKYFITNCFTLCFGKQKTRKIIMSSLNKKNDESDRYDSTNRMTQDSLYLLLAYIVNRFYTRLVLCVSVCYGFYYFDILKFFENLCLNYKHSKINKVHQKSNFISQMAFSCANENRLFGETSLS